MRSPFALSTGVLAASLCFCVSSLATAQTGGPAAPGRLSVELNKLEQTPEGSCRAYFLFRTGMPETLETFQMSLAILNGSGVIDRLLTVDAGPIPVGRTTLKLFEVPQMDCSNISEVLLHDLGACKPQNGAEMDCFPLLDLSSRAAAPLVE